MEFEGLVIQVIPQKERDLIARVLLRQGTLTSFYVYGGMGGGKNSKPRLYEPGNLVKVHVRGNQSGHTSQESLKMVNEGSVLWQGKNLRHHPQAFALACLYLEITLKTALPHHDDDVVGEHQGLFNALSNGLFYLDQAVGDGEWSWTNHFVLFMGKFLHYLGILPDENECVFCGSELETESFIPLIVDQGGYSCQSCYQQSGLQVKMTPVRHNLTLSVRTRFQDWRQIQGVSKDTCQQLIEFWGYHYQVKLPDLTSYRLLG